MTVVVNHDTNSVIWCAIGFGSKSCPNFLNVSQKNKERLFVVLQQMVPVGLLPVLVNIVPMHSAALIPSMWFPGLWKHLKKYGAEHWQQQVLKLDLRKKESLEGLEKERRSNQPLKKRRQ